MLERLTHGPFVNLWVSAARWLSNQVTLESMLTVSKCVVIEVIERFFTDLDLID